MEAGLPGLAKALTMARPRDWWRVAYKKARDAERQDGGEEQDADEEGYKPRPRNRDKESAENEDDPLERLGRFLDAKFKQAQAQPKSDQNDQKQCSPAQAAEFAMRMQEVKKKKFIVPTVLKFKTDPKLVVVEDSEEEEEEERGEKNGSSRASPEQKVDSPTQSASPVEFDHILEAPPDRSASEVPAPAQIIRQTTRSATLDGVMAFAGKGLPEDFHVYQRGISGEDLHAEDTGRARIFHRAWKIYRQRVGKWFDVNIAPQLEVWRQRGIRTRSMTEEAFDTTLFKLSGLVQDELSEAVAPGFHEASLAREQPPRGRPKLLPHAPWAIPTLDRLVAISRRTNHFHGRDDAAHETDMACRPAILMSSLPLHVGTEPSSAVLCVRTPQLLDWRRACAPQALGARALVNGVSQLLTNYRPGSTDPQAVEMEVIVPRIVLKVPGTQGEVVCGLRIAGNLQSTSEDQASVDARDVESESPDAVEPAHGEHWPPDERLRQQEMRVSWDEWHIIASEALMENTMAENDLLTRRQTQSIQAVRPGSPKTLITVSSSPRALNKTTGGKSATTGFSPRQRPRSKLWPGMEQSERLLPRGVEPVPPKLPLIRELRGWQPTSDGERGLVRSWRCSSPRALNRRWKAEEIPTMTGNAADFNAPDTWSPRSSRSQLHSHADSSLPDIGSIALSRQIAFTKTMQSKQWSWLAHIEGSPVKASFTEERFGNFYDHFQQLYRDVLGSCFAHWVPVTSAAFKQDRPMTSGCYAGGGGGLIPTILKKSKVDTVTRARNRAGSEATPSHPLAMSESCESCGKKALARVPLEGSFIENIWGVPACIVCIACGFVDSSGKENSARTLEGDSVLEVTTSLLVRPTMVAKVQKMIQRVLRLKQGQCAVAMVRESDMERRPTRAISRVASVAFVNSDAAIAAASAIVTEHLQPQADDDRGQCGPLAANCAPQGLHELPVAESGPFAANRNWILETLSGTGLDLEFGHVREISVDQAIEELDDKRMLPLRQEVSPLLLWVELKYVLSADFDLIAWNMSLNKIYGQVALAAAIMMRMNIVRLREALGAGHMKEPDGAVQPSPARGIQAWPLALHRVIVTRATEEQSIMSAAVKGAGLQADSVAGLLSRGTRRHAEQLRKLELREMGQDIDKDINSVDVDEVMQVVIKTRTIFGNSNRAILQARRILKRKQVFTFLYKLHDLVTNSHDDSWAKLRQISNTHEEEDDEEELSSDSDEPPLEEEEARSDDSRDLTACQLDDEDLLIHGPPRKNDEDEQGGSRAEALTIVKVLGHFKEYIHYAQMTLMSAQVISVLVRTVSKFVNNELFGVLAKNRRKGDAVEKKKTSDVLEKTMLDQDFTGTACRALYRHHAHPELCREVLSLMRHLVQVDSHHGMQARAVQELFKRKGGIFTLFFALGNMCLHGHRDNVLSTLQILAMLAEEDHRQQANIVSTGSPPIEPSIDLHDAIPMNLAVQRFDEVARITVTVLRHYWNDEPAVTLLLQLLHILCGNALLCRAMFVYDLTAELRKMLLFMATGEMSNKWFEDAKTRTGMKLVGPSGRGLRKLRNMTDARIRVNASCSKAESECWRLLYVFCSNSACNSRLDMKTDRRHTADAKQSMAQALEEMRRDPRTAQWHLAVEFLSNILVSDLSSFLNLFLEEGGLQLLLAELPSGQAKAILPLVVATLDAVSSIIPEARQSHIGSDTESDDDETRVLRGSHTTVPVAYSHGVDQRSKARARTVPADMVVRAQTASPGDATAESVPLHDLLEEVKVFYSRNGATHLVLSTLTSVYDKVVQDGCLRIVAELLQDTEAGAQAAVQDFLHFRGGGPQAICSFLSLENEDRVIMILYALEGAMIIDEQAIAAEIAEMQNTIKVLIKIAWRWILHRDIRRRALRILRSTVALQPKTVSEIAFRWEAMQTEYENTHQVRRRGRRTSSVPAMRSDLQAMDDEGASVTSSKDLGDDVEELDDLAEPRRRASSVSKASEDEVAAMRAPKEMRHFGAMLRVHRYKLNISSADDIHQVVSAMEEFTADEDICRVAIAGLLSGAETDIMPRYPALGSFEDFDGVLKTVAQLCQDASVVFQLMRIVSGFLDSMGAAGKAYLQPLVLTILKVLYVKTYWSADEWEALLFAITTSLDHGGKSQMIELDVVPRFEEEWEGLKSKDDPLTKMLVTSYREQTETTLRNMG
eukprot:TRINITY_DN3498_c0_g2_i1.p1 TRINITY_DN3498_c0_g2~~TRINITY_DN3498_c0_g2_i1.p1  ORF type:complete len:2491 (+),score=451.13 TRINITY_DN3498_c0_g2_i1:932-7474(+)